VGPPRQPASPISCPCPDWARTRAGVRPPHASSLVCFPSNPRSYIAKPARSQPFPNPKA
jgi:hypothetical protein